MILGQLKLGAHQTKNEPLALGFSAQKHLLPYLLCQVVRVSKREEIA